MNIRIFSILFLILIFSITAISQVSEKKPALTTEQQTALAKVKTDVETKAAPIVAELAETAKKIFANMLSPKEDQKLRRKLARDLHKFAGQLLDIKGGSFRSMLAVLTPEQKVLVLDEFKKPGATDNLEEMIVRALGKP